jgi:hypothetical protein
MEQTCFLVDTIGKCCRIRTTYNHILPVPQKRGVSTGTKNHHYSELTVNQRCFSCSHFALDFVNVKCQEERTPTTNQMVLYSTTTVKI